MKSVAVIHTGGLGDFLQTFPVLSAIRRKWPGARITIIGHLQRACLAQVGGLADKTVELETCGLHRLFAVGVSASEMPPALRQADLVLNFLTHKVLSNNYLSP